MEHTKVIFRKWANGDVIAIFPQLGFKNNNTVTCYEHVGQHGEGDYLHLLCKTKPAKAEEYADLLA